MVDLNFIVQNENFQISWATFEGIWAITHIIVLIGIRNSTLEHLRAQQLYFFVDGLFHLFNVVYYPIDEIGFFGYLNARAMLLVHIYFWINLVLNPPSTPKENLKPVFQWSCVEHKGNRFDISKYYCEILGTVLDIVAHGLGCYLMMMKLNTTGNVLVLGGVALSTYIMIFVVFGRQFSTHLHMMPPFISNFFGRKKNE